METLEFEFPAQRTPPQRAHAGVVSSGDLEILLEPSTASRTTVRVRTSADGFGTIWHEVLARFVTRHPLSATIEINDSGATPGTAGLRLAQAAEIAEEAM